MDHVEWHADQETVRIEADSHEFDVAYREQGSGDPPTLFLHGVSGWGFVFREVCDAAGHAIVPDLPGHGYTQHVGPGGYDRSIRAYEEHVHGLLDALGYDTARIVGHDIGGSVGLRLAVNSDRIDRLVLSNAPIYDSWPSSRVHELGDRSRARNMTYREVESLWREKFEEAPYHEERATEEFVEGMIAPFIGPDRDAADISRNAISLNTNHTLELVPQFGEVEVPTLLLWGYPGSGQHVGYAERLADALPNVEKRYLEESHHWVIQDRPDAYREALREFLG